MSVMKESSPCGDAPRRRQSGLSLVELLVGVAVGLFIVGGATKVFVDYLSDSRILLIETRINQDLRAAADIVARDLRRAGYWQGALSGASYPAALNPYRAASPSGAASASVVTYSFSRDAAGAENNAVDSNETLGFQLQNNTIEMQVGANTWQPVTDPNAVKVTEFTVTPVMHTVSLGQYCTPVCALGSPGCPSVVVRRYDIVLKGEAPNNSNIRREIRESVRLRNDELPVASCP